MSVRWTFQLAVYRYWPWPLGSRSLRPSVPLRLHLRPRARSSSGRASGTTRSCRSSRGTPSRRPRSPSSRLSVTRPTTTSMSCGTRRTDTSRTSSPPTRTASPIGRHSRGEGARRAQRGPCGTRKHVRRCRRFPSDIVDDHHNTTPGLLDHVHDVSIDDDNDTCPDDHHATHRRLYHDDLHHDHNHDHNHDDPRSLSPP